MVRASRLKRIVLSSGYPHLPTLQRQVEAATALRPRCRPWRHASRAKMAAALRRLWHLHGALCHMRSKSSSSSGSRIRAHLIQRVAAIPTSFAFDRSVPTWRPQRTGGCPEPSSCGRGSARSSPHSRGLKLLRLAARSSLAFLS